MAKKYHLHLKGFVGDWDFDPDYVDFILGKNEGQEVDVLIDSLGGNTHTALSISAAFARHGQVNVHFVGMNASAATIASMGAARITIDSSAMYLVHRCSVGFLEWGYKNANDLQTLIASLQNQKENLEKIDSNVAEMYARRCKKSATDLLDLMNKSVWLTAAEAKEWGFVDEVTDFGEEEKPKMTTSLYEQLVSAGIPIPEVPFEKEGTAIERFIARITNLITPKNKGMKVTYATVGQLLQVEEFESVEGKVSLSEEQMTTIEENAKSSAEKIASLEQEVTTLKAQLEKKPAEESQQVVNSQTGNESSPVEDYVSTVNEAQALYDIVS